jgi:hypothetical protein
VYLSITSRPRQAFMWLQIVKNGLYTVDPKDVVIVLWLCAGPALRAGGRGRQGVAVCGQHGHRHDAQWT